MTIAVINLRRQGQNGSGAAALAGRTHEKYAAASTLEMAAAYGAFAVKGQYIKPVPITLVRDRNGNVLEKANPEPKQVVKPSVANEMDEMLRAVVTEGTARNVGNAVNDAFGAVGYCSWGSATPSDMPSHTCWTGGTANCSE